MTMRINKTKAHEVIDRIDSFHRGTDNMPLGFDMRTWYCRLGVDPSLPEPKRYATECRTSACLAGWTIHVLDGPDTATEILQMKTDVYGGIGERFMEVAGTLLDADSAARLELNDLFIRLSYGWDEAREHFLHIIDGCQDVTE
jgi:hypothetical protein